VSLINYTSISFIFLLTAIFIFSRELLSHFVEKAGKPLDYPTVQSLEKPLEHRGRDEY
jgi:hypothetical protein